MKTQYFVLAILASALTACGEKPQQVQYAPQQYAPVQQAAPIQAAPAPVIVNAPAQNNGSDAVLGLAAGAALGAVAANAMNNNSAYQRDYNREPQRVISNTTIIKEKKFVVVQAKPETKPAYAPIQQAPKVNLSKPANSSQSYKSPTVSMKQSSPSTSYGKR